MPVIKATIASLLGLVVAIALLEVGLRLAYEILPAPVRGMIRHVERISTDGILGPSWLAACVGDEHYAARNLPELDEQRAEFGPALYHISTGNLGFEGFGFRGTQTAEKFDAVVVGDSFAFCHHIEYDDCWVKHVSDASGLKIANLAVPATASVSHSRYLEEIGRKLNPSLVIWQYWVNDPREDAEHVLGGYLPCPRANKTPQSNQSRRPFRQWLKASSVSANLAVAIFDRMAGYERKQTAGVYVFETTAELPLFAWRGEGALPQSEIERSGFEMTSAAIGLGARRTMAAGGRFVLVIAPSNLQVYADTLPNEILRAEMRAENSASDRLVDFAREREIEVIDLRPGFIAAAKRGEILYPSYDVHWNQAGNRLAAALLTDELALARDSQ